MILENPRPNKILIINGATRPNGNTDQIIKMIMDSSANKPIMTKEIILRKISIKNCIGC